MALREIEAEGRALPSMLQAEMLDFVRSRLAPAMNLDDFIRAHIEDESLRRTRTAALSEDALILNFRGRCWATTNLLFGGRPPSLSTLAGAEFELRNFSVRVERGVCQKVGRSFNIAERYEDHAIRYVPVGARLQFNRASPSFDADHVAGGYTHPAEGLG